MISSFIQSGWARSLSFTCLPAILGNKGCKILRNFNLLSRFCIFQNAKEVSNPCLSGFQGWQICVRTIIASPPYMNGTWGIIKVRPYILIAHPLMTGFNVSFCKFGSMKSVWWFMMPKWNFKKQRVGLWRLLVLARNVRIIFVVWDVFSRLKYNYKHGEKGDSIGMSKMSEPLITNWRVWWVIRIKKYSETRQLRDQDDTMQRKKNVKIIGGVWELWKPQPEWPNLPPETWTQKSEKPLSMEGASMLDSRLET